MPDIRPQSVLLSIPAAREQLGGVSRTLFYGLIKSGKLKLVKLGRRSFVRASDLERFISEAS